MSLAAERTYLAYVRTSLTLIAAGVAVVGALPDAGQEELRRVIGVLLVALGVAVAATARQRWRSVTAAMRAGRPLPRGWVGFTLTAGMVAAGVLGLILVLRL
jgi:putative membrane protein